MSILFTCSGPCDGVWTHCNISPDDRKDQFWHSHGRERQIGSTTGADLDGDGVVSDFVPGSTLGFAAIVPRGAVLALPG